MWPHTLRRHTDSMSWVPVSSCFRGVPEGMQYLKDIEHVIIERYHGTLPEYITPPDGLSRIFRILNQSGEQVYYAFEFEKPEPGGCCQRFRRRQRPIAYHITNRLGNTVFYMERPPRKSNGCVCIRKDIVNVFNSKKDKLGYITTRRSLCKPSYRIRSYEMESGLFNFKGSCSFLRCFCCKPSYSFTIETAAPKTNPKRHVGLIHRDYNNLSQDRGAFCVSVPTHVTLGTKAVILAGSFFINNMYYDSGRRPKPDHAYKQPANMQSNYLEAFGIAPNDVSQTTGTTTKSMMSSARKTIDSTSRKTIDSTPEVASKEHQVLKTHGISDDNSKKSAKSSKKSQKSSTGRSSSHGSGASDTHSIAESKSVVGNFIRDMFAF